MFVNRFSISTMIKMDFLISDMLHAVPIYVDPSAGSNFVGGVMVDDSFHILRRYISCFRS